MADDPYLLHNAQPSAGLRLRALAAVFDPWTRSRFDRVGVGEGWRCWEVGAGGTSVLEELARRVGHGGRVLGTDIDTSWAGEAVAPIEIKRHDVASAPPDGRFDLVHARLVLVHVPERARALENLVEVLDPGGWLLLEDADPGLQPLACLETDSDEARLANRIRAGFRTLMAGRGADLEFGRSLPALLEGAGLADVESEAFFPVSSSPSNELELATIASIGDRLVASAIASEEELARHRRAVESGALRITHPPMISAWGRRPEGP